MLNTANKKKKKNPNKIPLFFFFFFFSVDLHENESADKNVTVSLDHDWLQQQEHVAKWVPYRTSSIHILLHLTSVVVRLDPDSAFHFDVDLDPDPDPVPTFAHVEKSDF